MVDVEKAQRAIALLLEALGKDVALEGLSDTPRRVATMYAEIFSGLARDPARELEGFFSEDYDEMIMVKDIPFYSMCEHHLVPFFGKAHIAYIPQKGMIAGLGRLATVVEIYARRPQIQERMTRQIAELLHEKLQPAGVMVVIEAEHMCMTMRGVNKPGTRAITSAVRGVFADDAAVRAEVMTLIKM